ncbi:hypothetical protein Tco_1429092 [Tanacetum coccineum]
MSSSDSYLHIRLSSDYDGAIQTQFPEEQSTHASPNYVPEPEYTEYLVPSDVEVPMRDQPLTDDALPIPLSPGYVADFDSKEGPNEDPREDPVDYTADGGDDADDE